jgi:putative transposase
MARLINETARELVGILAKDCKDPGDLANMLKELFAGTLEKMLEAELDEHLGYEKNDVSGNNSGNSRNGYGKKTIKSEWGESEIDVPRDRNGTFEPKAIEKRQTRTDDIEQRILAMYTKGMTTRDIEEHLRDIYGIDVSSSLVSRITDKIMPEVNEWQNRPLSDIYSVVFFDGIVFKSRKDSKIINKCVYTVLGIDMDGQKEILGFWISENESASFWASVCNDLRNRGVRDILIACHDNLKGLDSAITSSFPQCVQQLCIIHQIRNSTRYVSWKDRKEVCADLKRIYKAVNIDDAGFAKEEFREKWDKKYPSILRSWDANWTDLITYFDYNPEIRRLIYTTNAVEGFHRMLRKFTKTRSIFPTDDAVKRAVYMSVLEISKKWTQQIRDWGLIYSQLVIKYEDRLKLS